MGEKEQKAEEKILDAAVEEFIQKGKTGARMQEIANKAGINKALLHYYYRSKDKLFEAVFALMIKKILLSKVIVIIEDEDDVFALIRRFSDLYIGVLNANPGIPFFILEEIHKNPERLSKAFMSSGLPVERVFEIIRKAVDEGKIRKIDPQQLIVNLISLCVFPFVGKNMILPVIFKNDKKAFDKYMENRKKEVADFVIESIKK